MRHRITPRETAATEPYLLVRAAGRVGSRTSEAKQAVRYRLPHSLCLDFLTMRGIGITLKYLPLHTYELHDMTEALLMTSTELWIGVSDNAYVARAQRAVDTK